MGPRYRDQCPLKDYTWCSTTIHYDDRAGRIKYMQLDAKSPYDRETECYVRVDDADRARLQRQDRVGDAI